MLIFYTTTYIFYSEAYKVISRSRESQMIETIHTRVNSDGLGKQYLRDLPIALLEIHENDLFATVDLEKLNYRRYIDIQAI